METSLEDPDKEKIDRIREIIQRATAEIEAAMK